MEFVNGKDDIPNILQLENNPFMFQTTKQIIVVTYGPIAQELVTWDHLHGQRITHFDYLWLKLCWPWLDLVSTMPCDIPFLKSVMF